MILRSCGFLQILPIEFAASSKPLSRDSHRKAPYPTKQQLDEGAG